MQENRNTPLTISIFLKTKFTFILGFPLPTELVSKNFFTSLTTLAQPLQGTSQASTPHRPFQTSVTDLIPAYTVKGKD